MFFRRSVFILFCIITGLVLSGCNLIKGTAVNQPQSGLQIQAGNSKAEIPSKKFKILHIMSYHSPWEWTDTQFEGFRYALDGVNVEYKVFQMDAKNKSTGDWKEAVGKEARELIDSWQPDLVYASDDEAQQYVARYYLNTTIPFVFSGINKDPRDYGFTESNNVAGVLEVEHFVESASLFKKIVPHAQKIAVVFDDSPIWEPVRNRMKSQASKLSGLEFSAWDTISTYSEYQRKIKEYETQVDGICLVGIFNFKDQKGNNVHYRDVLRWTAENSRLPDFSFWIDRVSYGTLCVVSVSGYEQGLAAGKIAREILVDGIIPASFPMERTAKGQPGINLARAKALGLKIDSQTLLSSRVLNKYAWEK